MANNPHILLEFSFDSPSMTCMICYLAQVIVVVISSNLLGMNLALTHYYDDAAIDRPGYLLSKSTLALS